MKSLALTYPSLFVVFLAVLFQLYPSPALDRDRLRRLALDHVENHRQQRASAPVDEDHPLTGVTVVITGATSGIGKSITSTLHGLGATVVAMGRSLRKLHELEREMSSSRIVTVRADLDDLESVSRAADEIKSRFSGIDYLVNNAGMNYVGDIYNPWLPAEKATSRQGYDMVFAVNYLSHFLLTAKLLPLLWKDSSRSSLLNETRVVQISSTYHYSSDGTDLLGSPPAASVARPGDVLLKHRSYGASKLAQIYHARALQRRYSATTQVRFVSICPLWVATNIGGIVTQAFQYFGAFSVDGAGISSALDAMFLPGLGGSDQENGGGDFVNQGTSTMHPALLSWMPYLVREFVVDVLAAPLLLTQRFLFRVGSVKRSSGESYDEVKQESLYRWSEEQVKPWL